MQALVTSRAALSAPPASTSSKPRSWDLDDYEAVCLIDHPPSNTAARRMPRGDRPAPRRVTRAILFFPRHVDGRIALGGSALTAPTLRRFPPGRQFGETSRSSSSMGATKSVPAQVGSSATASSSAFQASSFRIKTSIASLSPRSVSGSADAGRQKVGLHPALLLGTHLAEVRILPPPFHTASWAQTRTPSCVRRVAGPSKHGGA
jgi:hypothetical protein